MPTSEHVPSNSNGTWEYSEDCARVQDQILENLDYSDGSRGQGADARVKRKNADCFGAKFSILTHHLFLGAARSNIDSEKRYLAHFA